MRSASRARTIRRSPQPQGANRGEMEHNPSQSTGDGLFDRRGVIDLIARNEPLMETGDLSFPVERQPL